MKDKSNKISIQNIELGSAGFLLLEVRESESAIAEESTKAINCDGS